MCRSLASMNGKPWRMPCLFLILVLAFPRVALATLFLFTHYLDRAFHSIFVLILGFIFLPITTLLYAWMINSGLPVEGINLLWLLIAALVDLGALGGGYSRRRR
jgi:Na+/phosphate symporter